MAVSRARLTALAVGLVLATVSAPRVAADERDPREAAAFGVLDLYNDDLDGLATPDIDADSGDRDGLGAGLGPFADPRWAAMVTSLDDSHVRLVATAFRVSRGGGSAAGDLTGADVLLGTDARARLRTAIGEGALRPLGRVAATAALGATLRGDAREIFHAAVEYECQIAIGSAITAAHTSEIQSGLVVMARAALHTDDRLLLAFHARALDTPVTTEIPSIAGVRTDVSAAAFVASGAVLLGPGDLACVRGVDERGDGFVILLRLTGRPHVPLPAAIGDDHIALPTGALLHRQRIAHLPTRIGNQYAEKMESADSFVPWLADLPDEQPPHLADLLERAEVAVEEAVARSRGVTLVRVAPGAARAVLQQTYDLLTSRRTCVLTVGDAGDDVEGGGGARIVVPFLEGGAPTAFLGRIGTRTDGFEIETGCDDCMSAADYIEYDWEGLVVALGTSSRRAAEIRLARRHIESRRQRDFAVRRLLPGHATFAHDQVPFEFVASRDLQLLSALPADGGALPGGIVATLHGRAAIDEPVTPIAIDGDRLFLVPDGHARVRSVQTTPRVINWGWEGSCGMTLRYPEVTAVTTGRDVAVRPDDALPGLRIVAEVLGDPRTLPGSPFDMGDGVVELLETPRLVARMVLPLGRPRLVAWGAGLELRVGSAAPDAEAPLLRTVTIAFGDALAGVRFAQGLPVTLHAGMRSWTPGDLGDYESNHSSGAAWTMSVERHDGVTFSLGRSRGRIARGWVGVRGEGTRRPFALLKFQAPRRPDTAVNLLLPTQAARDVPLVVADGRALDLEYRLAPTLRISVAPATVEEDE